MGYSFRKRVCWGLGFQLSTYVIYYFEMLVIEVILSIANNVEPDSRNMLKVTRTDLIFYRHKVCVTSIYLLVM